jgi:hypothetical protein
MFAEEVFVNCNNFYPIKVQHASIHGKKYWDSSQKRYLIFKVSLINLFGAGGIELEPEPQSMHCELWKMMFTQRSLEHDDFIL